MASAHQLHRGVCPAGDAGRASVLQHLRRRTAVHHRRVDHSGAGHVGPLNLSITVSDPPVLHSVLQLLHRNGSGVRLHPAGIVYLVAGDRRRALDVIPRKVIS